ncbi:MAG: PadR family transcriptional regulator [Spirochaetes bacterium]|nr:PadR family transcriptional regulator [Spirochaetota bacterium]
MKVPLYILGFLERHGPLHGYMLKKLIAERVADFAHIKLPTIYYHLEKMRGEGLVSAKKEQEGKRPERSVYAITQKGKKKLREYLRGAMASIHLYEFMFDAPIFFLEFVDREELLQSIDHQVSELTRLMRHIEEHREETLPLVPEPYRIVVKSLFGHHEIHYRAELEWAKSLRRNLETMYSSTDQNEHLLPS